MEIEPSVPYDSDRDHYNALAAHAKKEHDEDMRPVIKNNIDISGYEADMGTPDFILELRKYIGHRPLWLIGVTACVFNKQGQVLLGQRSDTQQWALIYGINEPGEEPADTVVREVKEETEIDCLPTDLVSVKSSSRILTYENGDQTQYMDHLFLCRLADKGNEQPKVGDEESLAVGWFSLDKLPSNLADTSKERLDLVEQYLKAKDRGSDDGGKTIFTCTLAGQYHADTD